MLKERLSRIDSNSDNYVEFDEFAAVMDDAHRGRWGTGLNFADVKALAATLESVPISVTVRGAVYSTGATVTTGLNTPTATATATPAPTLAPSTAGSGSLPFIGVLDSGTILGFPLLHSLC